MKLPEDAEWTARFPADLRRIGLEVESLYRPAQQLDSLELLCIGEGGIDTLRGSFENCLLMDGFCGVREAIMGGSPGISRADCKTPNCGCDAGHPLAPREDNADLRAVPIET